MKTRTKQLKAAQFISDAGQLSMSRLVDATLEALDGIRINGVGRQRARSRGVIRRSFYEVVERAGFARLQAEEIWRDQVLPLESLAINAE
jgi:hypothetical protein